jgi:YesN/AraC family two-component response regulator
MGETYKFQFLLAKNAEEAQRLMHYKRVDLVITDHRMPGITGTELILWIKKNHPEVPIILMSSDAENPIHQADGFLTKPLNIFLLEKLITELLAVPV